MWLIYLFGVIAWALIWGFATRTVIYNKGYSENGFWWGFFFGIIAFIIALSKKERYRGREYESYVADAMRNEQIIADGGWRCLCGRTNHHYVSTCVCGRHKRDILAQANHPADDNCMSDVNGAEAIKKYKDLFDDGIITKEEFEEKKRKLLRL